MPRRGPSIFVRLPSDWVSAATDLLWPIFIARQGYSQRRRIPRDPGTAPAFDREAFYLSFHFPKEPTRSKSADRGVKRSTLEKIARRAGIELDGLLHGIVSRSKDPTARQIMFGSPATISERDRTKNLSVFLSRREILGDDEFLHALETASSLDMIALSAAVAETLWGMFFRAALLRRDFRCRLAIFDPGAQTIRHYVPLVRRVIKESPATKRKQARRLLRLAEENPRLRIKVIRNLPLMYNLWIARDATDADVTAHISLYFYDPLSGGPSFRATRGNPLVARLREEFEYVWTHVAVPVAPIRNRGGLPSLPSK